MLLKKEIVRRTVNFILISLTVFIVFLSLYFYTSSNAKISSISSSLEPIRDALVNSNSLRDILVNLSSISWLIMLQIVAFVAFSISLIAALWFVTRLYLVESRNSLIDPLTGIYNKRAMAFGIDREIKRSIRYKHPLSVAIMDIDFFKKYNDTNGHVAGDNLLSKIGTILKNSVRDYDFVGRVGGEEFMIILPETSLKKSKEICERIRESIEKTRFSGGGKLPEGRVTISVGVAEFHGDKNIKREKLVEEADSYLYEAKQSGRNRVIAK